MAASPAELLIESHEERLQETERAIKDVIGEVSKHSAKMEEVGNKFQQMGEQIKVSGERVAEKIDLFLNHLEERFGAIDTKLDRSTQVLEQLGVKVTDNTTRLVHVEDIEAGRTERKAWIKKSLITIATLTTGAGITKLVAFAMDHSHFFNR